MRLSQGGLAYTVTTLVHILLVKLKFSTCAHPITLDIALPVCLKRLLWTRLGWIRCAAGWSPHAGDGTCTRWAIFRSLALPLHLRPLYPLCSLYPSSLSAADAFFRSDSCSGRGGCDQRSLMVEIARLLDFSTDQPRCASRVLSRNLANYSSQFGRYIGNQLSQTDSPTPQNCHLESRIR
ncbi:uncharacterized protein PADG_07008 [Paracoccidioides brasiliensis Pb18]|uniref:Uncharacterized protein n=2 Tax=Paracoccidioides brasiliensis TaxID=121759 RepID=C1GIC2_PARBD|nr:uncharacterized protein PADG_07008 [Paracoccidioides brasiliensis Pb18]EEH42188.2 hypothetical protein PADG_07008 [Paracoccidioides brasiliensis Pb18]